MKLCCPLKFIQRNETLTQKIVYLLVRLVCLGITNKQTNKQTKTCLHLHKTFACLQNLKTRLILFTGEFFCSVNEAISLNIAACFDSNGRGVIAAC